jgi:hypothetical protein
LEPRLPVSGQQVFRFRKEYIEQRNLIAWSFFNPKRPSEIVDIVITHDLVKLGTKRVRVGANTLKILAIDHLIRMKEAAGRPQDLEDAAALRRLKK